MPVTAINNAFDTYLNIKKNGKTYIFESDIPTDISICTISGEMIVKSESTKYFSLNLKNGLYLLKAGNKTVKFNAY